MRVLLKNTRIVDSNASCNGLVKQVLLADGIIRFLSDSDIQQQTFDIILDQEDQLLSPGWVDIFTDCCDPGFEHRETLTTTAASALKGGYTTLFSLPNTHPVVQSKTQVAYIVQQGKQLPIHILPLGAISKNTDGKELAEMYDMHDSGAIAFSDGTHPVQTAGLLLKALQYVKAFNGVIVQMPTDKSVGTHGLINEGIISTQLGLPGIPALAEEMMVQRDLALAAYTDSHLHLTGISTAKSVALIAAAKEKGIQVTCSVTPYHLFFCDEDVMGYNTNLKVNPPLRNKQDMLALRTALANGLIDAIATHHIPVHWDNKTCEFEYAHYGMLGLQTAFSVVNQSVPQLSDNQLVDLFSNHPRKIFKYNQASIEDGSSVDCTLFSRKASTTFSKTLLSSKSSNTPFLDTTLSGKVLGTFSKGIFHNNLH